MTSPSSTAQICSATAPASAAIPAFFFATNASLKTLLEAAYNVRPDLITGVPPALESQRYDLTAKVLDPDLKALNAISKEQRRSLLIPVLQDRFALKAHLETKDLAFLRTHRH